VRGKADVIPDASARANHEGRRTYVPTRAPSTSRARRIDVPLGTWVAEGGTTTPRPRSSHPRDRVTGRSQTTSRSCDEGRLSVRDYPPTDPTSGGLVAPVAEHCTGQHGVTRRPRLQTPHRCPRHRRRRCHYRPRPFRRYRQSPVRGFRRNRDRRSRRQANLRPLRRHRPPRQTRRDDCPPSCCRWPRSPMHRAPGSQDC